MFNNWRLNNKAFLATRHESQLRSFSQAPGVPVISKKNCAIPWYLGPCVYPHIGSEPWSDHVRGNEELAQNAPLHADQLTNIQACWMGQWQRRRKLREQSSSRCAGDVKTVHQKHPEGTTHSQCQQLFPELCDRRKMWPSVLENPKIWATDEVSN